MPPMAGTTRITVVQGDLIRDLRIVALLAVASIVSAACTAAPPSTSAPSPPASIQPSPTPAATGSPLPTEAPTPAGQVEHRIGVRVVDGAGEFFDRATGEPWVPRGNNYIRLSGFHSTLNPAHYDPLRLDQAMARMAAGGYNVVRLFMSHRVGGLSDGQGLSAAHMDNAVDALRRAKAHGLQVMFTQDWNPEADIYGFGPDPGIEDVNSVYLATGGIEATRAYFQDFTRALIERNAPFDAMLAYELRNELHFTDTRPPFSLTSGQVTAANGKTYDMSRPADRDRLLQEGLVFWFDTMRAAILQLDPTALVTVGFFQPHGPNTSRIGDDRLIETEEVILRSTADFIDLHGYPGGDLNLRQIVENYKLPPVTDKPIILGEFGAEDPPYATIEEALRVILDWQTESCRYGFDGWVFWSWDGPEQAQFWKATDAGGAIERALSPRERPDPCSS